MYIPMLCISISLVEAKDIYLTFYCFFIYFVIQYNIFLFFFIYFIIQYNKLNKKQKNVK